MGVNKDTGASQANGLGSAEAPEPSGLGPTGAIPSARDLFALNSTMNVLRVLYRNGVNDGLRETLKERTRGEDRCIRETADYLIALFDAEHRRIREANGDDAGPLFGETR